MKNQLNALAVALGKLVYGDTIQKTVDAYSSIPALFDNLCEEGERLLPNNATNYFDKFNSSYDKLIASYRQSHEYYQAYYECLENLHVLAGMVDHKLDLRVLPNDSPSEPELRLYWLTDGEWLSRSAWFTEEEFAEEQVKAYDATAGNLWWVQSDIEPDLPRSYGFQHVQRFE